LSLGVLIPIIIHLWNIQQGKILKVGSVALLTKDAIKSSSSIKLHELLLLILRCLLILLLAALLSKPQWNAKNNAGKGWLMIDKNDAQQTYNHFKPQIDSLMQAGYELHYFNNGFEKTSLQNALSNSTDSTQNINYWAILRQLINKRDGQIPLYIFTNDYLNKFTGTRPTVQPNIHWYNYTQGDTSSYPAAVYAMQGDSIKVITANSSATGTYNTYSNKAYAQVQSTGADTATLYVTIYNKGFTTDAGYVKAAIEAIQQFSRRKIKVFVTANLSQISQQQSWLFWLSNDVMPANVKAQNIFVYEKGKEEDVHSWVKADAAQSSTQALYKRVTNQDSGSNVIWSDGFGRPLLAKKLNTWHFYSRFDASWNDLPWSHDFPQMIYSLLINDSLTVNIAAKDKRIIDDDQLQPATEKENIASSKQTNFRVDISNITLLLAFIVFFIERIISSGTKKERVYA